MQEFPPYETLLQRYAEAETAVKTVENLVGDFIMPSINQLRYAGRHLAEYLTLSDDNNEKLNQYNEFVSHCDRAEREAWELGIIYLLEWINDFDKYYRSITVTDVIQNYIYTRKKIRSIQEFLDTSPMNGQNHNKIQFKENFIELREIYDSYDLCQQELNKKLMHATNQVLFSLIAILLTILGIILSL